MTFLAAALPAISVATTVATGVLSYMNQQRAAAASRMQAEMMGQQMQQQALANQVQLGQQRLAIASEEIATRDEANRMRRAARQAQNAAMAATAARGIIAQPYGSFGAILGDAEDELYRDLEANRMERGYKQVAGMSQLAGDAALGAQRIQTIGMERGAALADAGTRRLQAYSSLGQSLIRAYEIAPSKWTS